MVYVKGPCDIPLVIAPSCPSFTFSLLNPCSMYAWGILYFYSIFNRNVGDFKPNRFQRPPGPISFYMMCKPTILGPST